MFTEIIKNELFLTNHLTFVDITCDTNMAVFENDTDFCSGKIQSFSS